MKPVTSVSNLLRSALIIVLIAPASAVALMPALSLQGTGDKLAGRIADGTPLLTGTLSYHQPHRGFMLEPEGAVSFHGPGRYRIQGEGGHLLNVRLETRQPVITDEHQNSITLLAGRGPVQFMLVTDGYQNIAADRWNIRLTARAIFPE